MAKKKKAMQINSLTARTLEGGKRDSDRHINCNLKSTPLLGNIEIVVGGTFRAVQGC